MERFFTILPLFIELCHLDLDHPSRVTGFQVRSEELAEAFSGLSCREQTQALLVLNAFSPEWREFLPAEIVREMN